MSKVRELLKQLHEQLHINENDAGFDAWMSKVNAEVDKLSGMRADDLPDVAYRDWYDDGLAPSRAARRAIKNAEMGEDVGKPEGGNPAAALDEELSRKYYVAIAQILKDNKEWDAILQALIGLFKSDNPRFSADRFAQAAGASPELELGESSYKGHEIKVIPHERGLKNVLYIDGKEQEAGFSSVDAAQKYGEKLIDDPEKELGEKRGKPEGGDPKAALGEAMSRQEYASIAHVIRGNTTKEEIANQLAGVFVANDNRFDREQFLKAAGVALAENAGKPKPGLSPRGHGPVDQRQINKDRAAADRDFEHEKKFGRAK